MVSVSDVLSFFLRSGQDVGVLGCTPRDYTVFHALQDGELAFSLVEENLGEHYLLLRIRNVILRITRHIFVVSLNHGESLEWIMLNRFLHDVNKGFNVNFVDHKIKEFCLD